MRPAATREQHDTYFDTPERELQGVGAALRVRRVGDETLATYKGPGAVVGSLHTREETEVPFAEPPTLPTVEWPEAVRVELTALGVETARLRPVLDLYTTRTRYQLYGSDGSNPLAELSFDEVRAAHGERHVQFRELELEAHPDTPDEALARLSAAVTTLATSPRTRATNSRTRSSCWGCHDALPHPPRPRRSERPQRPGRPPASAEP